MLAWDETINTTPMSVNQMWSRNQELTSLRINQKHLAMKEWQLAVGVVGYIIRISHSSKYLKGTCPQHFAFAKKDTV